VEFLFEIDAGVNQVAEPLGVGLVIVFFVELFHGVVEMVGGGGALLSINFVFLT
jgi:hypothetical protein